MANPFEHFTADAIAAATGCPRENVAENWPRIVEQLTHAGINERPVQVGLIGTVAIESASTFAPVEEAFWLSPAARQAEYERRNYGGGPAYHGRGFIQVTHLSNYRSLGPKIAALWGTDPNQPDFDLVGNPDAMLNPDLSAAAAAIYFRDTRALPTPSWPAGYSLIDACRATDWEWIRRLVYGGRDQAGEQRLARIAGALGASQPDPQPGTLTYNPDLPPELQVQDWACSIRATTWVLKSLGVNIDAGTLQDEMVPGRVTPELGLLDARGYGIAETIKAHLDPSHHDRVHVFESISWDELRSLAGQGPIALGGRRFGVAGHWVSVRRPGDGDSLEIMNPAPGYTGVGHTLTRQQFDQRGPFSAVWVNTAGASVPEPGPTPPTRAQELIAELERLTAELKSLVA
jgi:hypothetical protein